MNLYFRLIICLIRAWRLPPLSPTDALERSFRVLPNDIDINAHMNNGRYLTMVDLMLMEYFIRIGFAKVLLRNRWRPMSGGSFITYRRGISPFKKYRLRYRVDGCDEYWNFMRFEFFDGDKVAASGFMKGAAVGPKGLVPNSQTYQALGQPMPLGGPPAAVNMWMAAEKELMATAW